MSDFGGFILKILWQLLIVFLISLYLVSSQLIRSVNVYKGVIKEVCDYYQCFSITLFYSSPPRTEDIDVTTRLMDLSMYFESELLIRTTVTDVSSYAAQFSSARFRLMVKPLFVLLNDSDDMKVQLATMLIPLMDISKPMWTIFMRDETSIEDFFQDVYIPFNCKFMASKKRLDDEGSEVIAEIYRVYYGKQLKQDIFATWNISTGLDPPSLGFNLRRRNLDNQLLRVNSMNRPPGAIIIKNEKDNTTELGGFCGEMLLDFQKSLNFRVSFEETKRGGRCFPNGTCTHAIAFMQTNQSDMLALEMVLTTSRIEAIQYLSPLYLSNIYLYISKPNVALEWNKYLTPFNSGVWFTIAIMIIIIGSLVTLIRFISRMKFIDKPNSEDEQVSFVDSYFIIFAALCGQGMKRSQINSLRFIQFTIHATSIVLLASYSAILISLLAVNHSTVPVMSIEALLNDKSYKVATMNASAEYSIFQSATDGLMMKLLKRMEKIESSFPTTRFEGLQRACDDKKFAFVTNGNTYLHFNAENCYLIEMENIIDLSTAFSVPKHSPFIDIFNCQIDLLREAGVLKKLFDDGESSKMNLEESWSPVELIEIFPLLALIIGSSVLSVVILMIEKYNYSRSINQKFKNTLHNSKDKKVLQYNTKFVTALK